MNSSRRKFLQTLGATGLGTTLAARAAAAGSTGKTAPAKPAHQQFNMCGYAAPAIETVRVGVIGVGGRGIGAVRRLARIEGIQVIGLCDVRPERIQLAQKLLAKAAVQPKIYSSGENAWHALCDEPNVDLIYICTPWSLHTPMAVRAMEHGKHAAVEVPAATTLEECWRLVDTSERTRRHCMMLENCCYGFFELLTLKMAREGYFGEIIHGEGAYIHDLRANLFNKTLKSDVWRLRENWRNGNLYPTHGLGPICQIMNINRGDRMEFLVSVSSQDFHLKARAEELARTDEFFVPYSKQNYRGNMNTSVIRTQRGRTILVQHDVTSPRPYSRLHTISGTKAMAQGYPAPAIAIEHKWATPAQYAELEKQYTPELVRQMGAIAKQEGGHGGMDFLMDWRLMSLLRNGQPLDQDVYDAALWSAIGPLTEWSVANGSKPVVVPDFTRGAWPKNAPLQV
jgi:predicted dehydrogenase